MKYAYIQDAIVREIIEPFVDADGNEVPLAERFHADYVAACQEIPDDLDVAVGDSFDGEAFGEPPAPPAAPVPQSVSARQARLELLARGKLAAVATALDALPAAQRDAAKIEWEFATVVERSSPLVEMLGAALKLDLDALFTAAAQR